MNELVSQLNPVSLWQYFTEIAAIPRASKKEEKIIAFLRSFGLSLELETVSDHAGNVVIRKPATEGMHNRQTVVLQSHVDMVHQKNAQTGFDFETQGIDMFIDGDWVKAKGTTLGADNGIGVASMMALLAADNIPHPQIEALFTVDEETGMTGAKELQAGLLTGKIMLNLDTEDDDELTIGCAGGIDVTIEGAYQQIPADASQLTAFSISITGLAGGHSGVDIQLGRANANKLMNRLLSQIIDNFPVKIFSINGGSLRNAIPRESVAAIAIGSKQAAEFRSILADIEKVFKAEYAATDAGLQVLCRESDLQSSYADENFIKNFLSSVYACPNGIYRMTPGIEGLVQTSNNLAKVVLGDGKFSVQCLTRSSLDSEKMDEARAIASAFYGCAGKVSYGSEYPGWAPEPQAPIIRLMESIYLKLFNQKLHVNAIHAGLECGIIGSKYLGMQMVSFGPNIYGAHSPDERVQISSVEKFWQFLLEILKNFPEKNS